MSGYLETQTAEKLQNACDAIKRMCKLYEISELYKLGFLTRNDMEVRLQASGFSLNKNSQSKITLNEFIPTRILAKILGEEESDWFWYAHDIFTTFRPGYFSNEQIVSVDEMVNFLHKNERYAKRVRAYNPETEEEAKAKQVLVGALV